MYINYILESALVSKSDVRNHHRCLTLTDRVVKMSLQHVQPMCTIQHTQEEEEFHIQMDDEVRNIIISKVKSRSIKTSLYNKSAL